MLFLWGIVHSMVSNIRPSCCCFICVCVLSVSSSVALVYVCLALGLEPGRLGCTRKGDKTTSIYNGRYVSTHNGNA